MVHLYIAQCNKNLKGKDLHMLGISLLSEALHGMMSADLTPEEIENRLTMGNHGKPALKYPDVQFNISNTSGLVICGLCDNSPIGVDTEKIRDFKPAILRKVLSENEHLDFPSCPSLQSEHFFRLWTLKEARLKLSGQGLSRPMTDFSFHFTESYEENIVCSDSNVFSWQMLLENEYIISVCTDKPEEIFVHILP